jgi:broad specificity phosphatase PhoE
MCSDKNCELSDNGQQQGRRLSEWFADKKLDLILTSNLLRTQQTAEFISQSTKAKIKVYAQLAERNVGIKYANLELRELKEIRSQEKIDIIDPTQDWFGVTEVESDELVFKRTKEILQKHIVAGKNIACVTHAGVIKAFLHTVLNIDKSRTNAFKVRNACVLIFQNENTIGQIQLIGMHQIREL